MNTQRKCTTCQGTGEVVSYALGLIRDCPDCFNAQRRDCPRCENGFNTEVETKWEEGPNNTLILSKHPYRVPCLNCNK